MADRKIVNTSLTIVISRTLRERLRRMTHETSLNAKAIIVMALTNELDRYDTKKDELKLREDREREEREQRRRVRRNSDGIQPLQPLQSLDTFSPAVPQAPRSDLKLEFDNLYEVHARRIANAELRGDIREVRLCEAEAYEDFRRQWPLLSPAKKEIEIALQQRKTKYKQQQSTTPVPKETPNDQGREDREVDRAAIPAGPGRQ